MKVALAQIRGLVEDVEANCCKIASYAEQAAQQGCHIVIFPEMSDTGYVPSAIQETASSWTDRPFTMVRDTAARLGIFMVCGMSERVDRDIYNSIAIFSSEGKLLGQYRKTHLFSAVPVHEDKYFTPGVSLATILIGDMTWGFSICYDLRFPELYHSLALRGAEVLVNCSAWPVSRVEHWEILARARAIENQAYMIGVNRVGTDGELTFCGRSCIVEPLGDIVSLGSVDKEELVVGEISKDKIVSFRHDIPVFQSRREYVYSDMNDTQLPQYPSRT